VPCESHCLTERPLDFPDKIGNCRVLPQAEAARRLLLARLA
jgi:hypothetical protein